MAIVRGVSACCLGLSPAHMRFSAAQHSRRVWWQIWLSSTRSQGQSLVLTLRCPPESAPDFGSLGDFSRLLGLALGCCCFSPAHQDVMLLSESTAAPPSPNFKGRRVSSPAPGGCACALCLAGFRVAFLVHLQLSSLQPGVSLICDEVENPEKKKKVSAYFYLFSLMPKWHLLKIVKRLAS